MDILKNAINFKEGREMFFGETKNSLPFAIIKKIKKEMSHLNKIEYFTEKEIILLCCLFEPINKYYEYWLSTWQNKNFSIKRSDFDKSMRKALEAIAACNSLKDLVSKTRSLKIKPYTTKGLVRYCVSCNVEIDNSIDSLFFSETFNSVFINIINGKRYDNNIKGFMKEVGAIFNLETRDMKIKNYLRLIDFFESVYSNGCEEGNCYDCPVQKYCEIGKKIIATN